MRFTKFYKMLLKARYDEAALVIVIDKIYQQLKSFIKELWRLMIKVQL